MHNIKFDSKSMGQIVSFTSFVFSNYTYINKNVSNHSYSKSSMFTVYVTADVNNSKFKNSYNNDDDKISIINFTEVVDYLNMNYFNACNYF